MSKGSLSSVVDCLLVLRDSVNPGLSDDISGDVSRTPSRKKLIVLETDEPLVPGAAQGKTSPGEDSRNGLLDPKSQQKTPVFSGWVLWHGFNMATSHSQKFHEIFQLKRGSYADLPAAKISEMMHSNSLDRVVYLLRKVVQEIEHRLCIQAEHIRNRSEGVVWLGVLSAMVACDRGGGGSASRDDIGFLQVATLNLSYNQLSGPITSILGNLTYTEKLNAYGNKLNGTIPRSLCKLESMTYLNLSSNYLSGLSIPAEFGNLSIMEIDLSDNHLGSLIPQELGMLQNLILLKLENNNITGDVSSLINCFSPSILGAKGDPSKGRC